MRKLKLDLDALTVSSFETSEAELDGYAGTVHGLNRKTRGADCPVVSAGGSCFIGTCPSEVDSCVSYPTPTTALTIDLPIPIPGETLPTFNNGCSEFRD